MNMASLMAATIMSSRLSLLRQQTERSTVGWAALLAGCERRHCCDDQVIGQCTVARTEIQQAVSAARNALRRTTHHRSQPAKLSRASERTWLHLFGLAANIMSSRQSLPQCSFRRQGVLTSAFFPKQAVLTHLRRRMSL